MKKIILSVALVLSFIAASAQFPSIDSMRRFNNRYIRTSPIEAFTNYRLNTLLHGILTWLDDSVSTGGGGGGSANLTFSRNATTLSIFSDGGTDVVLPRATHSLAGLLAAEDMRRWDSSFHLGNATGSGDTLLRKVNDSTALIKRLIAGTGITLTPTDDNITITSTGGGGVSDGDKGDITISGSGATFTIDNNVVTEAKMSLSDVGTWNATTGRHGFLPKLNDSATYFLNGQGNWEPIGAGGLQATLTLGDTTNKTYVYKHRPQLGGIVRQLDPQNLDSSYVYLGPTYQAGRWSETLVSIYDANGSGRPNVIWMEGYNQNGGGGRENSNEASFHHALESHYETGGAQNFEWHKQITTTTGTLIRLESWLINKQTGGNSVYYSTDGWDLRNPATNVPYFSAGYAGIDMNNPAVLGTNVINMYSGPSAGHFRISSGNGIALIGPTTANWDMKISTPRNLEMSNNILFTDTYTPNNGSVAFFLPGNNADQSFYFRNAGEHILQLLDGATFNTVRAYGQIQAAAGTTLLASINIPTGVEKTSLADGDIWRDASGDMWLRKGSTSTKLNDQVGANPITGSGAGTAGTIPKYTANYTLANSLITEASDLITVTGRFAATDQVYIGTLASDPATNLANGAMYYNTTTGKMKVREAGAWVNVISSAGTAVVTSVALAMPSGFSVANSPITSSGTLNVTTTLNGVIVGNGSGFTTLADGGMAVAKLTPGSNGQYLTVVGGVATWGSLSGGGDVVGPASAVDNQMVLFNSTTGKLIKASTGSGFAKYSSGVPTFQSEIISGDITSLVYTKVNNFPTARLAGRTTASTGAIEALTVDGTLTLASGNLGVNQAGLTLSNLAGAVTTTQGGIPTGGTANQILAKINSTDYNTQWVTPGVYVTDGVKDDITVSSSGTLWSITSGSVTPSMLASQSNNTVLANISGGSGSPSAVSLTAFLAALDVATPSTKGLVPSGGSALQILRVNAGGTALEWASGAGGGESSTASNGLTLSGVDIKLGGALTGTTSITGAFALSLGTNGSKLSTLDIFASTGVSIQSDAVLSLMGTPKYATETATDANYTWTTATPDPAYVDLPTITANRTLTLPSNSDGVLIVISNLNNSTFNWSFTGGTVKNQAGSTITNVPYGVTRLRANGTDWIIQGWEGTKGLIVLQANDVNSDGTANTLDNVDELNFPVISGLTYRFKFFVVYSAAATTTGSRWTISAPAVTFLNYNSSYSLTATTETKNQALAAINLPAASNATSAATGSNIAIVEGVIRASATGTVQLRFASEVSSSAITALAFRSYVEYEAIR